jgi:hypothetical protein
MKKIALELFDTFYKKSATYKDLLKYNKMIRKNLDNVKTSKIISFFIMLINLLKKKYEFFKF